MSRADSSGAVPPPPPSAVSVWTGVVGTLAVLAMTPVILFLEPGVSTLGKTVQLLIATGGAMVVFEYARLRRGGAACAAAHPAVPRRSPDRARVFRRRVAGSTVSIAFITFVGTVAALFLGEPQEILKHLPLVPALAALIGAAATVGFALHLYRTRHHHHEACIHYRFGAALAERRFLAALADESEHFRQWLLKLFFIPVMFFFAYQSVEVLEELVNVGPASLANIAGAVALVTALVYLVDIAIGAVGYMLPVRSLDAHIRSTQPTILGWVSCLMCYPPFLAILFSFANFHETGGSWSAVFEGHPIFLIVWGGLVTAANGLYVWATMIFGIRFSNLTNRGIITNGPYRYFKHPAYLGKNVAWWLTYVPFLTLFSPSVSALTFVQLASVSYVYYVRAKTEEEHLRADPEYRAYETWIGTYGTLPRVRQWVARLVA